MKSYNLSADIIRVLAIIGVIIIHTANAVFARPDFFGGISWWFAIVLDSLSRIAVPLFIILSGYFILNKDESYVSTLKRTIRRIIFPLLIWFSIYLIWNNGQPTLTFINLSFITRLLTVNVFDLYFLVILAGLYLVAPLLRAFLQKIEPQEQKRFTLLVLIIGCITFGSEFINNLCSPADSFTYWLPYTGLFVAGYVFGRSIKSVKKTPLIIIYLISLGTTIILSYFYYSLHNNGNALLDTRGCLSYYSDSYLSINVVVMSICAFLLLIRQQFIFAPIFQKLIYSIARCSFGIYLVHMIYLSLLDSQYHLFDHIHSIIAYIVIKFVVIFLLSYSTVLVLMKIKYINKIFGESR